MSGFVVEWEMLIRPDPGSSIMEVGKMGQRSRVDSDESRELASRLIAQQFYETLCRDLAVTPTADLMKGN